MTTLFSVALGGAVGAASRHLVGGWLGGWLTGLFGGSLPLGNVAVNLIGSFLLGVLIEFSALSWSPSPDMRSFLVIGLLGGFTTFSAFSLEVVVLFERGRLDLAALYAIGSVVLAIGGLFIGMKLMRAVLA
ncbi:MAG: fluoride efflux transporter CrcB [Rhodospirillales bacterium]|nr:fluoride efflux transporter CrcB [Rhodospirillales bacterium]